MPNLKRTLLWHQKLLIRKDSQRPIPIAEVTNYPCIQYRCTSTHALYIYFVLYRYIIASTHKETSFCLKLPTPT